MASSLKRKNDSEPRSRKTRKVAAEDGQSASAMDTNGREEEEEECGGVDPTIAASAAKVTEEIASAYANRTGTKPIKPPTGEELREIKDATDLFRSSSFKLQIDALLPNVRPKPSRIPPLDRFLLVLHAVLIELPSVAPKHPLDASRSLLKKGISVPYPFPLPTEDTNWKVAFEPPSDITLVGSWANKVAVKAKDGKKIGVDMAVEMPATLFQEKDYLNGRFFHKRAFYLATIAAALQKSKKMAGVELAYDSVANDPRLTTLIITPAKDDSQNDFSKLNAHIRVLLVLPTPSPIPLHRLSPTHSNIRITTASASTSTPETEHPPTTLYNTALLTTLTPKPHLLTTHTLQASVPSFTDALTLLRIWANQRGYGEGARLCVHGFDGAGVFWSSVLGLLVDGDEVVGKRLVIGKKRKSIGRGLSSYQMFKAALDFLATHDFHADPIYVRSKDGHRFRPEEYETAYDAVFVDASSTINLLAGIPQPSLDLLRYDARKTLEILDHTPANRDPFKDVFLREQRDLATRFDTIIRVDLSSANPRTTSLHATLDHGSASNALLASLITLLRRGLGDRTKAIAILHPSSSPRALSQAHPSTPSTIHIGLIHDPEHAFRLVEHGPSADETDSTLVDSFRELWGDKAELRRFKDGRIAESVAWEVTTTDERAQVPAMVVKHLLRRHFGVQDAETWQTPFDAIIKLPEAVSRVYASAAKGSGSTVGFKSAMNAFDALVKGIKAVDDELPLSVLNVSPVSGALRYTSVFTPAPLTPTLAGMMPGSVRYLPTMEIVLEFEKSSRWPDDLKAIQKIKLAFFERVAAVLLGSIAGLKANVVVGDGDATTESDVQDKCRLELVTAEGWAFSARIWHEREATLLDRVIESKSKLMAHIATTAAGKPEERKGKEYHDAVAAKELYTRRFIHAPRHHRAIASLCHQYASYAGTVRLVKRWLGAHWLLHSHIREEVVEIICASFFVGDGRVFTEEVGGTPKDVPGSKERGFAAVVEFLKEWAWEDGLFVPLYGSTGTATDMTPPAAVTAGSKSGAWIVSTEHDREGRAWTTQGPDLMVAHRVRALAKATWELLQGLEHGQLDVKALFTHPTQDYDFVVQLDPTVLPRYFQNAAADPSLLDRGKYANLKGESGQLKPDFDPARYLFEDLQRIYADTFKIFYDPFGGDRFGAVWDPTLSQPRPFRVMGGFSSIPAKKENEKAKDKGMVVLNQSGVLSEIETLGVGLVKEIIVHV